MSEPKYPNIQVKLVGHDGNAFAIIGRVKAALAKNGVGGNECQQFLNEAMSGDYNNVLQTCMKWVKVS